MTSLFEFFEKIAVRRGSRLRKSKNTGKFRIFGVRAAAEGHFSLAYGKGVLSTYLSFLTRPKVYLRAF
ncbi:MAG: hypothetical protein A4E31_00483 [Methanomassiliicoccales archaeon PtaU1.Bin030]|nr:MAG: hypothetical protein A4E31_00483 [Methanomassiliicoccales archaeon PtaU1.Bin030]